MDMGDNAFSCEVLVTGVSNTLYAVTLSLLRSEVAVQKILAERAVRQYEDFKKVLEEREKTEGKKRTKA